jgi:hypothetical protein
MAIRKRGGRQQRFRRIRSCREGPKRTLVAAPPFLFYTSPPNFRGLVVRNSHVLGVPALLPAAFAPLFAVFAVLAGFAGSLSQIPYSVRGLRILRGLRGALVSFLLGFAGPAGFAGRTSQLPYRVIACVTTVAHKFTMRHAAPWKRAVPVDNLWITCGKPGGVPPRREKLFTPHPPLFHHLSTAYPQLIHRQNRDLQRSLDGLKVRLCYYPIMWRGQIHEKALTWCCMAYCY